MRMMESEILANLFSVNQRRFFILLFKFFILDLQEAGDWCTPCIIVLFCCACFFCLVLLLWLVCKNRSGFMRCSISSHLIWHLVTPALNLLQSRKVVNAMERLHLLEGPNNLFNLRSRSLSEADAADGRTLNNKKVKIWELIFVED